MSSPFLQSPQFHKSVSFDKFEGRKSNEIPHIKLKKIDSNKYKDRNSGDSSNMIVSINAFSKQSRPSNTSQPFSAASKRRGSILKVFKKKKKKTSITKILIGYPKFKKDLWKKNYFIIIFYVLKFLEKLKLHCKRSKIEKLKICIGQNIYDEFENFGMNETKLKRKKTLTFIKINKFYFYFKSIIFYIFI